MRTLMALVLAGLLAAGCAAETADPEPSGSTATIGPEDTLPVLGAWESVPLPGEEPLTLTLSDDNTFTVTDTCVELPGRWQLSQGRVLLTPKAEEVVLCDEDREAPLIPDEYVVEDDRLVPEGAGPTFTRM